MITQTNFHVFNYLVGRNWKSNCLFPSLIIILDFTYYYKRHWIEFSRKDTKDTLKEVFSAKGTS